ncbi:MAG: hypothetical protein ACE14S_02285 [Candidatus Bathyarchaeia archaeon]
MSETQEDDGNVRIHKITVDRSPELEALRQELENVKSEKEQLESELTLIAERTLNEKCKKYGIDEDLTDEQKIEKVKKAEKENQETAPLNDAQIGSKVVVNDDTGYDSIEAMVHDLNKKAEKNDGSAESTEADVILNQFGKKIIENVKTSGRQPFNVDIDPKELQKLRNQTKRENAEKLRKKAIKNE